MAKWTDASVPDQSGKVVIVTGASGGIGEEAASVLAGRGAQVVLAVRDASRGEAALGRIKAKHPAARVNVLLNNAGLMQTKRSETTDGFERMFGTNHLGHFALTGLLIDTLKRADAPRVVTIASIAHRRARIDFEDLQGSRGYSGSRGYGQSKLANLMFALELDRRARAAGSRILSVAAHPGVSTTGFVAATGMPTIVVTLSRMAIGVLGQDAASGALPGLYASTMPDVRGGQYWGPDGFQEVRGSPHLGSISPQALDRQTAARLWSVSEELTRVSYPPLG